MTNFRLHVIWGFCLIVTISALNPTESSDEILDEDDAFTCPQEPKEYYHYPHRTNCTKFYKCTPGGVKVLFTCPPPLHFNPDIQVCDWPKNINGPCYRKTQIHGSSQCPANQSETNVHLPHEDDCEKFYQCANGRKILRNCPKGLQFNSKLSVCDLPRNAGCEGLEKPS